jgi:hypothetical protein
MNYRFLLLCVSLSMAATAGAQTSVKTVEQLRSEIETDAKNQAATCAIDTSRAEIEKTLQKAYAYVPPSNDQDNEECVADLTYLEQSKCDLLAGLSAKHLNRLTAVGLQEVLNQTNGDGTLAGQKIISSMANDVRVDGEAAKKVTVQYLDKAKCFLLNVPFLGKKKKKEAIEKFDKKVAERAAQVANITLQVPSTSGLAIDSDQDPE